MVFKGPFTILAHVLCLCRVQIDAGRANLGPCMWSRSRSPALTHFGGVAPTPRLYSVASGVSP